MIHNNNRIALHALWISVLYYRYKFIEAMYSVDRIQCHLYMHEL